jgi:hypothetical protein
MQAKLTSALLAAATALTGLCLTNAPAEAFTIQGRSEAPTAFQDLLLQPEMRDFVGKEARYLAPKRLALKKSTCLL